MKLMQVLSDFEDQQQILLNDLHKQYSVAEVIDRVLRLSGRLGQLQGHCLALCADNGVDWLLADLACQETGHCLLPLPTFFSNEQMSFALQACSANFLLTDNPFLGELDVIDDSRTAVKLEGIGLMLYGLKTGSVRTALPDGTGKITFTSGSTGTPKGVCLSHEQQIRQARTLQQLVALENPKHLCLLPLSTLLENVAGIYAPILAAGQIIVPSLSSLGYSGSGLKDSGQLLTVIARVKPDSLILVPELLQLLVTAAAQGWPVPDSLSFIAVGGSRVAPELLARAQALGLPVFEGYGLSECCSVVSLNNARHNLPGSGGKPLPGLNVTLDDGEILVRGNSMLGYVNEPEGWYSREIRTGDLGHIDEDGFLTIHGRRKNLVISSFGRNISPEWVEAALLALPGIARAVVFGDARPYCVALIANDDTALSEEQLQNLIDKANQTLPDYARIKRWQTLPALLSMQEGLYTANGRPRRQHIAERFGELIGTLYKDSEVA